MERLNTVEILDGNKRMWSRIGSMSCKRSAVGAAALQDRLYVRKTLRHIFHLRIFKDVLENRQKVCGGYDGITSLNTVESYDPNIDVWTSIAPMTKHRSAAGVVAFDNQVYALGGHDGLSIFDSVERYDPQTGLWTAGVPMLSKRCRLGVAVLDGKLYACGGYDGSTFLRSVECFDPRANKWSLIAPMTVTRSRVALAANAGKLWAVGGYDGTAYVYESLQS